MGPDAMILVFWMLSFKPTFSLSYFTFIKRFFSSSSRSAIRVVSSAYLRLLIFLQEILIPACASSSPVFLMMYSAYKLNQQGDNVQPWHTPFPIWNQAVGTACCSPWDCRVRHDWATKLSWNNPKTPCFRRNIFSSVIPDVTKMLCHPYDTSKWQRGPLIYHNVILEFDFHLWIQVLSLILTVPVIE